MLGKQSEVGDKADPPHAALTVTHISFYHLLQESDGPYTYLYTWTVMTLIFSFRTSLFVLSNPVSRQGDCNEFCVLSLNKIKEDSN